MPQFIPLAVVASTEAIALRMYNYCILQLLFTVAVVQLLNAVAVLHYVPKSNTAAYVRHLYCMCLRAILQHMSVTCIVCA